MTILQMSLGGAVLIAVILLLRHLALYRLPKWTFLLLWAVALCRLLVPFTLPSQLSVFTSAARIAEVFGEREEVPTPPSDALEPVWVPAITVLGTFREDGWIIPAVPTPEPEPEAKPVSLLAAVYWTGVSLCGLFFAATYLWSLRRFWEAEQVESEFLRHWQEEHRVAIRTCAAVNAPLAYGLVRPVVLLPENTDWSDEDQLTYILTHEYVHICRGDLFWKLLLTAALCVHWFNPLVWAMYLRANQDLELACDERVVRILGLENRKGYAYSLLAAAESGFSPLCLTYTTKHHMEERIRAIMKMKKKSTAVILCAAMLVAGISAVFATSPKPLEPKDIEKLPAAVMSNALPNPSVSAPVDKDVSAPDTSAVVDLESAPVEADTPDVDNRIHPVTDDPAQPVVDTTKPETQKTATATLENRWNVPADPIPEGTEIRTADYADTKALLNYLYEVRGMKGGDLAIIDGQDGSEVVRVGYYTTKRREADTLRLENGYPVNARGETYGKSGDHTIMGYEPDLIAVVATNGAHGYALANELNYGGYTGEIRTPEDAIAWNEWLETQPDPRLVTVYDVNRDNVVGYFAVHHGNPSDMTQEEELEMIADQMRKWGNSEEQIAADLEYYKQSRGWD